MSLLFNDNLFQRSRYISNVEGIILVLSAACSQLAVFQPDLYTVKDDAMAVSSEIKLGRSKGVCKNDQRIDVYSVSSVGNKILTQLFKAALKFLYRVGDTGIGLLIVGHLPGVRLGFAVYLESSADGFYSNQTCSVNDKVVIMQLLAADIEGNVVKNLSLFQLELFCNLL